MLGGGFKAVMEAFNASRPLIGARGVGLAQGALDHAIEFVTNRAAFGQQVSDFQGCAGCWPIWRYRPRRRAISSTAPLRWSTAARRRLALAPVAAMAKCFASDTAMKVATDAVQLFGAAGISSEYPINRYFRDAKVLQIIEGTNQIQRNIISNSLLGRPNRK